MSLSDSPRETLDAARGAIILARLRAAGWSVAVHNDYRQEGQDFTFWLFTHRSGIWARGEGATDYFALLRAESEAEQRLQRFGIRP